MIRQDNVWTLLPDGHLVFVQDTAYLGCGCCVHICVRFLDAEGMSAAFPCGPGHRELVQDATRRFVEREPSGRPAVAIFEETLIAAMDQFEEAPRS